MQDPFSLVGTSLEARYQIDSVIGEGGFGVVYRGTHLRFDHPIAVKCLKIPSHFTADAKAIFLQRFKEEGKILLKLGDAPGVPRVYDYGIHAVDKQEVPFLVMEWLAGQTLEEAMERRRKSGAKNLQPSEAIALMLPVIDAIALAHENNIAHRDIKPANLFLATNGRTPVVKVLDFGIAKAMQEGETLAQSQAKTQTSFRAFTPNYAAPEQFTPKRFGASGPWTDVHALGLVMVELLTGKPANPGDDFVECLESATNLQRPSPQGRGAAVSDELEAVVMKAVALKADERYPNARAFATALRAVPEASEMGPVTLIPETDDAPPLTLRPPTGTGGTEIIVGDRGSLSGEGAPDAAKKEPKKPDSGSSGTVISGTPTGTKLVTEQPVTRDKTEIAVKTEVARVERREPEAPARSGINPIMVGAAGLAVAAGLYLAFGRGGGGEPSPSPAASTASGSASSPVAGSSAAVPAGPAKKEVSYARSFFATTEVVAVMPLDEASAKGTHHYRFTKEGGRVVLVERIGPAGAVMETARVSYPAEGGLERVETDSRGVLVRTIRFAKDGVETVTARSGSPLKEGCARQAFKLSPAGDPIERVCQDAGGNTIIDASGCPILRWEYDDKHQTISQACFQYDGTPLLDASGVHFIKVNYDQRGFMTETLNFAPSGVAVESGEGCMRIRREYDAAGNRTSMKCIGATGMPVAFRGTTIAALASTFDANGCEIRSERLDAEGTPVGIGAMFASTMKYDQHCAMLEQELVGQKGELVPFAGGASRTEYTRGAEGEILEMRCFDAKREAMSCRMEKGAEAPGAIMRYAYDDKGREISAKAFDKAGNPSRTSQNYPHETRTTYDEQGLPVEVAYFDATGAPAASLGNVAKRVQRFDPLGSVVSSKSFGADGSAVVDSTKTHEIKTTYDERHRIARIEAKDADGQYPSSTSLVYGGVSWPSTAVRLDVIRDGAGVSENRFFDKNGKEVSKLDCRKVETSCTR